MKTINTYINESFRLRDDSKITKQQNNILNDIASAKNDEEIFDIIEQIANSGKNEPDIWNDTEDFRTFDSFEQWEDDFGKSDDMYDVIKRFCDDNIVLGWKSNEGFDDLQKIVPTFFKDIIVTWNKKTVQQKMNCVATVWEKRLGRYACSLLKLNMHVNYDGYEDMEYWYMFIMEKRN